MIHYKLCLAIESLPPRNRTPRSSGAAQGQLRRPRQTSSAWTSAWTSFEKYRAFHGPNGFSSVSINASPSAVLAGCPTQLSCRYHHQIVLARPEEPKVLVMEQPVLDARHVPEAHQPRVPAQPRDPLDEALNLRELVRLRPVHQALAILLKLRPRQRQQHRERHPVRP